ncbi:MAG: hypothetical protein Q9187_002854 [Circinaria calcarea]
MLLASVFAYFLINISSSGATEAQNAQVSLARKGGIKERQLSAASQDTGIGKRSPDIFLNHDISMHYIDTNDAETTIPPFTATVSFKSKLPSLLLEDIEHLVDEIRCKPGSIQLTFVSKNHMETARNAFAAHSDLVVVTSHFGCNNEDSRIPWVYAWKHLLYLLPG